MTILSKKKGNSSKNNNNEGEGTEHIPHPHPQPESLSLNPERLYGERSQASQLWSQPQNIPREEKRETNTKRRHRASPIRCARSKHSRLERERAATSSPNGNIPCVPPNVANSENPVPVIPLSSSPDVTYNSEDEYEGQPHSKISEEEWAERERRFEKKMRKKGFIIKKMGEDGACLFRAVSDQVYGDQEMHNVVRKHCMDYIAANGDYYSQYVTEDFEHYVNRKRMNYVHGNHIEIQAMSEMYSRTIEVYCYSTDPINIFHGTNQSDNEPIRLSYHRGVHYNSLVDPYKATVGVGLGLPGHIPGLADKNIVKEATRQSEDMLIEQAMLEDKLRATDWEATNEVMEEQVARESYLQWLKDNERRNRAVRSPSASSSSATTSASASTSEVRAPRQRSQGSTNISPLGSPFRGDNAFRSSPSRLTPPPCRMSPPPSIPGPSRGLHQMPPSVAPLPGNTLPNCSETPLPLLETSSFINQLPPELFGMNEWDDAGLLAQVLAVSQQEYLDNLKRGREPSPPKHTKDD